MISQFAYAHVDFASGRTESVIRRETETGVYVSRTWIEWGWLWNPWADPGRSRDIVVYIWKQQLIELNDQMRSDPEFIMALQMGEIRRLMI
jgi:hypothetical protein